MSNLDYVIQNLRVTSQFMTKVADDIQNVPGTQPPQQAAAEQMQNQPPQQGSQAPQDMQNEMPSDPMEQLEYIASAIAQSANMLVEWVWNLKGGKPQPQQQPGQDTSQPMGTNQTPPQQQSIQ